MEVSAQSLYRLCLRASREVRRRYDFRRVEPMDLSRKGDGSPVTEADLKSSEVIVAGLEKLSPGVPVVSEESAWPADSVRRDWSEYWLVDPLDGTREFISGSSQFSINLALVRGGSAELGAIYLPLTGEMYCGGRAAAPLLYRGGQVRRVCPRIASRGAALKLIHSRSGGKHPSMRALRDRLREQGFDLLAERRGSAWKFCRLIEGGAHLYARYGATREWDTAAGQAMLEAVGGRVVDVKGQALRYNTHRQLINPPFFALAPADFDWCQVLGLG